LLAIHQRADNLNIHGAKKLNSSKINEPIKKWATELSFFKGRHPNGQKIHEKNA
jgi:hypothetical protein